MGKYSSATNGRHPLAVSGVAALALCSLWVTAAAETIVSANINTNTTWTVGGSPYIIQSSTVMVRNNSTLTIDPGVDVRFVSNAKLVTDVGSSIRAVGTAADSIMFTSNSVTPATSDWQYVQAYASGNSAFTYCVFKYANIGLYCNVSNSPVTRCGFRDCERGVFVRRASPPITECSFTASTYYALWCEHHTSTPVVYHCNFVGNANNVRLDGYTQATNVVAIWNWWGTSTEAFIEAMIVDAADGIGLGTVDYDPWLTQVPVESSSWGRIKGLFR